MNQITLLFDFGQEIFIVLNENKMFKTKVKNYTVYDDSILSEHLIVNLMSKIVLQLLMIIYQRG